ncbi:unnamed protein product [Meganyctiphanes norvegica]|uniref:Secreted protein n=1 Tax=Meganyctiphanes norvegica TaxID=48144 RepID=A0AAV2QAX2_MEGNR
MDLFLTSITFTLLLVASKFGSLYDTGMASRMSWSTSSYSISSNFGSMRVSGIASRMVWSTSSYSMSSKLLESSKFLTVSEVSSEFILTFCIGSNSKEVICDGSILYCLGFAYRFKKGLESSFLA